MNIKKITLICPHDDSLPLQVTSYKAFMPRYGLLAVASALTAAGFDVKTYCEFSGSRVDWRRVRESDAVCFSVMSFSALKAYDYAAKAKKLNPRAPLIFGGSHPSVLPEDCLEICDYVVRNEGEATVVALLKKLSRGENAEAEEGVSYKDAAGVIVHNKSRCFIEPIELVADPGLVDGYSDRTLLFYIRDALRNGVPRFNIAVVQASRGCPQGCSFCFVRQELGLKYRMKDPELVIQEIELSIKKLGTRYVFFADNDMTLDREHALEIFRLMEKRFGGDIDLFFFSRIFIAGDDELMNAVERAGRACVGVGIESIDQRALDFFRKKQTLEDIESNLELFSRRNVKLQLLFIFGSDNDTPDTIEKSLELALRHRVYNWGFCSMYDFPTKESVLGVPQILPDYRFIHRDWRFYSGNFPVHYPAKMRPSELQRAMSAAYKKFYHASKASVYQYHPIQATYGGYASFLEQAEKGLYRVDGSLIEERLPGPFAESRMLDIGVSRAALAGELARFYFYNAARAQSWRYLFSLGKRPCLLP